MTWRTSDVAVCCCSDSVSFFFRSALAARRRSTSVLAFVVFERRPVMRFRLFAPLRDKITSSAQSLGLPILTHDELASSFDHLVGTQQERFRDRQTKRLGGGQVDDEIELGGLLDRDITRLRPAQNLVNIISGAPELLRKAWPIGHETSPFNVFTSAVYRRQSSA